MNNWIEELCQEIRANGKLYKKELRRQGFKFDNENDDEWEIKRKENFQMIKFKEIYDTIPINSELKNR